MSEQDRAYGRALEAAAALGRNKSEENWRNYRTAVDEWEFTMISGSLLSETAHDRLITPPEYRDWHRCHHISCPHTYPVR